MTSRIPVSTLVFANSLCILPELNPTNPSFGGGGERDRRNQTEETIKYGSTIAYLLQN